MKRILALILLLFALRVVAQPTFAIKYIYQYPTASLPPTNFFVLIDPGNGVYNKATIAAIGQAIGLNLTNGSGTFITVIATTNIANYAYLTNLYSTNIFTTNLFATIITNTSFFTTNFTVLQGGGATNLNLIPNSLMQSDPNDAEASVPNGAGLLTNNGAGVFGWVTIASLTGPYVLALNGNGTNTTNWGVTSYQELDATTAYLTNITFKTLQPKTNLWSGPTNTIDLNGGNDLFYSTLTSCSIAGFSNKGTSVDQSVTLTLDNVSATNQTITIPASCGSRDGSRQYVNTNGQELIITFRYSPASGRTNSLAAINF